MKKNDKKEVISAINPEMLIYEEKTSEQISRDKTTRENSACDTISGNTCCTNDEQTTVDIVDVDSTSCIMNVANRISDSTVTRRQSATINSKLDPNIVS
jgi:hypothetical protein